MILSINKIPSLDNDYVDVKYRELTSPISQIIEICNQGSQTVVGEKDEKRYPIDVNDILYIEWVDGRSCICTAKDVYTSSQTLAQMEQYLSGKGFIRVSKPMLVNVRKIKWVSSMLNMKLMAELTNGERVTVSRHYRENMLSKIYELGKEAK